jgi:hypothetical protein
MGKKAATDNVLIFLLLLRNATSMLLHSLTSLHRLHNEIAAARQR